MRSGRRIGTALLGALLTISLIGAGPALATTEWSGMLPAGLPPVVSTFCDRKGNCPGLEGVVYADVNVSVEMEGRTESADYVLEDDTSPIPVTAWRLCKYDGDGRLLDCDQRMLTHWLWGELPPETREVRIVLVENAGVEWELSVA